MLRSSTVPMLLVALLSLACGAKRPAPSAPAPAPPPENQLGSASATPSTSAAPAPAGPSASSPTTAVVLARGLGGVASFAADDTFAYVVKSSGAIVRVPLAGGNPTPFGSLPANEESAALAVTAEGLYLATTGSGEAALKKGTFGLGSIMLFPSDGGKARKLSSGYLLTGSIVVDDAKIYWAAAKPGKKPEWSIFSAPRKTGTPVAAKKLGQEGLIRVFGTYKGAVLYAGLLGGVVAQPLGKADKRGPTVGTLMQIDSAVVTGDRLVIGGSDLDIEHGAKTVPTVGVTALDGETHTLEKLAMLGPDDHIGGVAVSGDDVFFTQVGTTQGKYKDGALVRVSLKDKTKTVLAADQFQPAGVVVTARGVVWLNERGHFVSGEGDSELLLFPRASK